MHMQKSSSEKYNDSKLVKIEIPDFINKSRYYTETWLSILEQSLAYNFQNYKLTVDHDMYNQIVKIEILFDSINDAALFRLQQHHL